MSLNVDLQWKHFIVKTSGAIRPVTDPQTGPRQKKKKKKKVTGLCFADPGNELGM